MQIKIIEVSDDKKVIVDTPNGRLIGGWYGDIPKVNDFLDVELEISDILKWGIDIESVNSNDYECGFNKNENFIIGCVESVEPDGYTVMVFGEGIICIETVGDPYPVCEFVKMRVKNIEFFDTGL